MFKNPIRTDPPDEEGKARKLQLNTRTLLLAQIQSWIRKCLAFFWKKKKYPLPTDLYQEGLYL